MRVLHVIPSLDSRDGGPSIALPQIAASLASQGIGVDVATTLDSTEAAQKGIPLGVPVPMGTWTCYYFPRQLRFYKASFPLRSWLGAHAGNYDLVHAHALFSFAPLAACRAARQKGVPYVVRPLGLLNHWGMQNRRRFVKALSFRFVERPLLNAAAAIHYTSSNEQKEAAELDIKARPVIIPLGMDTSPFREMPDRSVFEQRYPQARGRDLILFLSRIDPKKGLEILLQAMTRMSSGHANVLLVVAGSGAEDYTARLHALAADLGISDRVLWTGHLGPEEKLAALGAADLFVLPSLSENFGIALLEAMAARKACVATSGVALACEAAASGAIQLADTDAGALASSLSSLLNSPAERARYGSAAQALAHSRYSLEAMGRNLAELYHEILK